MPHNHWSGTQDGCRRGSIVNYSRQTLSGHSNTREQSTRADNADEFISASGVGRAHHDPQQTRILKDVAVCSATRDPCVLREDVLVEAGVHAFARAPGRKV